jgi:hypothetical protein
MVVSPTLRLRIRRLGVSPPTARVGPNYQGILTSHGTHSDLDRSG